MTQIKKFAFYGNENGPFEKDPVGFTVFEDGTVSKTEDLDVIKATYEECKKVVPTKEEERILFGYDERAKVLIDYNYTKAHVQPDKTVVAKNKDGGWGKFAAGALAGLALFGGISALKNAKNADNVPTKPTHTNDTTNENNNILSVEQQIAKFNLDKHFEYTKEQQQLIEDLSKTCYDMAARCEELGIKEAAFNSDEALIFSLMMSDVSNEDAARYCQTLGFTEQQMNDIYQSAVQKFQVIQANINKESDIHMFDNLLIKTMGQSDRLTDEENQQKIDRVLDVFHGALKYNVAINNADAKDIDHVKGTVKLADGRVLTFQEIMDYDFAVLKDNETKDMDGNTVYGLANNTAARKVFMDAFMMSHFFHTTNMDNVIIGDTYNVEGENIPASVAKEYHELNKDACDYTIDFETVAEKIQESNKQLTEDVIKLTGESDVKKYRDAIYGNTYDRNIESLHDLYNNKLWNELADEVENSLLQSITVLNNKIRGFDGTIGSNSYVEPKTERTVTTWTESASDVISTEQKGTGTADTDKLKEQYVEEKKDEYDDHDGYYETDKEIGYNDTNPDGSGQYGKTDKDSLESVEVDAGPIVTTTDVDGDVVTENPITGEEEHYNSDDVILNENTEDKEVTEEVVSMIEQAKADEAAEQAIIDSYESEGVNFEEYFSSIEDDNTNTNTNTDGTSVETETGDTVIYDQDHGPLVKTP